MAWAAVARIMRPKAQKPAEGVAARVSSDWNSEARSAAAGAAPAGAGRLGFPPPFISDDPTVTHGHDAIREGGDIGLVGYEDDRDALFAIERDQSLHDLVRCARIEIAGRLVGEKQTRRVDQGTRYRDSLLLSSRELTGRVALAVTKAECPERRARPLEARRPMGLPRDRIVKRQADILDRACAGEQIEALEDKAEALAAQPRKFRLVECDDIDSVEITMSTRRPIETAENAHQCRLARSRSSHNGNELAPLDTEADIAERLYFHIADGIRPADIPDPENGLLHGGLPQPFAGPLEPRRRQPRLTTLRVRFFGEHHVVAGMKIALHDLRDIVIIEPQRDGNRGRLPVAHSPEAGFFAGPVGRATSL